MNRKSISIVIAWICALAAVYYANKPLFPHVFTQRLTISHYINDLCRWLMTTLFGEILLEYHSSLTRIVVNHEFLLLFTQIVAFECSDLQIMLKIYHPNTTSGRTIRRDSFLLWLRDSMLLSFFVSEQMNMLLKYQKL